MSLLTKKVGIPIAEKLRGMPVSRYLNELKRSQWFSPEEIRALQNSKLARLIEHAYETVPFYRKIMDERGLKPADVSSVESLSKLPILTKESIRAAYPEQMISSACSSGQYVEVTSSGSTGEPFRYVLTSDEKAKKWAGLYLFWSWAGYEMGDRLANLTAFPPRAFKSSGIMQCLESRFSGILALPANELYSCNSDAFVKRLIDFRPAMLRGYTSSIYYLAEVMASKGFSLKLKSVATTGETLFDFQRELMESFYGCKVHDGYGGEGMEIAAQCGHDRGYHYNAASLILEVVDSDGNPCPDGVDGQIVLTDLNHYSMPFIRYNIQDVAAKSSRLCNCGRGLPMLDRISGRLTDIGVTPSGKAIVVHFFTGMFMKLAPRVKTFQVVQDAPDHVSILVVPGDGFEEVRDDILQRTSAYVGDDVRVELSTVDSIPTTAGGKRRLFISKCGIKAAGSVDLQT